MIDKTLIAQQISTQGYFIIDNFLNEDEYSSLRATAKQWHQDGLYKRAKIGKNLNAQQHDQIRTDQIFWIDDQAEHAGIQAYLSKTATIAQALNQNLFLGLYEFEAHFAAYSSGTFYRKHSDQFATTKDRKISCVYYLNKHWEPNFGGELKLYSLDDQLITSVLPQGNRFICFDSELPHEVCVTHQTRYSLSGWMKVRPVCKP